MHSLLAFFAPMRPVLFLKSGSTFPAAIKRSRTPSYPNRSRPLRPSPRASAPSDVPTRDAASPVTPSAPLSAKTAFAFGAVASAFGSLIGAGGGVMLTPLLVWRGVPQRRAHATSAILVFFVAMVSSARYVSSAAANLPAAALLTVPALLTAPLGAKQTARMPARTLRRVFGAFLLCVSLLIPTAPRVVAACGGAVSQAWFVPIGAMTGFVSGLFGVGGGTINVPTLLMAGLSQRVAQGTAMVAMVLPSLRASLTHLQLGSVAMELVVPLVIGALLGGFVGSSVAVRVPEGILRGVCCFSLACISLRYLRG